MADVSFAVGQRVRIAVESGRASRGLILCVGISERDDAATYDVLLDPATTIISSAKAHEVTSSDVRPDEKIEADRELVGLPASRLSRLQDFELDGSIDKTVESSCARLPAGEVSTLAEGLKNKGNIVFKLGDTDAAVEIFARVLRCLEPTPGVGSTVLVRTLAGAESDATTIRYRSGMVSDANDEGKSFDIIYDDTTFDAVGSGAVGEEDDEEDGVAADRVVATSISPSLSCAARLNLARCAYRGGRHAEVVQISTLVMSAAKSTMGDKDRPREERARLRAHCITALRMRGGSHLAQNHVALARKDARNMARSAGDTDSKAQAARFEAEVERKAKILLKANRKLAKDVTRWVDASMAKHEEASLHDEGDGELPPPSSPPMPSSRMEDEDNDDSVMHHEGGVEESKGQVDGGLKSWLGSWVR